MSKQFKNISYFMFFAIALLMQWSCKKKDVFPSQQLPSIISLSPSSAKAGTDITIKGSNLKNVSQVKFGTVNAVNFNTSSNTDTAIHVTVPDSLPLGPMYLQVYFADGKGYASSKFTVLETPPVPKVDSVSPVHALPGAQVTVYGVNFSLVNKVTCGGISTSFAPTSDTDHRVIVTIPASAVAGSQYINIINPNGQDSVAFSVDFYPVIYSFSPVSAKAGDLITVLGTRFTGATDVQLGGTEVPGYSVVNDTTLTFNVPSAASSGNISVTTPYGPGTSSSSLSVLSPGLAAPFYDDAINWPTLTGGWIGGGWGGTKNPDNTSPVESGSKSCKISYDAGAYGSPLQLGGANFSLAPYKVFKISIYGGPGSAGKNFGIVFNSTDEYHFNLGVEGQWNDYAIPLSSISSASNLTDIWIKDESGTSYYIYIDNMGLN